MADRQRINIRLVAFFIAAIFVFPVFFFKTGAVSLWASEKPKTHLSSNESLRSREKYRDWREQRKGSRRATVKKIGSVKLKKSTFWNKKPFQFSTPLVTDSMLFIGVDAGFFYGVDANKVKKRWQYKTEGAVHSQAGIEGDVVYFGDEKGYAYALSSADGHEIWKTFVDYPILTTPLLISDRIYYVTDTGRLIALRKDTGTEVMRSETIDKNIGFSVKRASSPVWTNGIILFGTSTGTLMAMRENGNVAWVKQLGDRQQMVYDLDNRPLVDGGRIYVATADRNVFCVDQSGGNIIWSTPETGGVNDLIIGDGKLYATGSGILSAINPSDGSVIWEQDFEIPEISSPASSNRIIAVATASGGKLYLVDDEKGDIMYERAIKGGSFGDPTFVGDRLYIITNTGKLYGFLVKERPAKTPKKG